MSRRIETRLMNPEAEELRVVSCDSCGSEIVTRASIHGSAAVGGITMEGDAGRSAEHWFELILSAEPSGPVTPDVWDFCTLHCLAMWVQHVSKTHVYPPRPVLE